MTVMRWQQLGIVVVAIVLMVLALSTLVGTYAVSGEFAPQPGPAIHPITLAVMTFG